MEFLDIDKSESRFKDDTDGGDGRYYIEIDFSKPPVFVTVKKGSHSGPVDPHLNIVRFDLGVSFEGKLEPLPAVPVIYINL